MVEETAAAELSDVFVVKFINFIILKSVRLDAKIISETVIAHISPRNISIFSFRKHVFIMLTHCTHLVVFFYFFLTVLSGYIYNLSIFYDVDHSVCVRT